MVTLRLVDHLFVCHISKGENKKQANKPTGTFYTNEQARRGKKVLIGECWSLTTWLAASLYSSIRRAFATASFVSPTTFILTMLGEKSYISQTLNVHESSISSTLMMPSIFRACWMFAPCAPAHLYRVTKKCDYIAVFHICKDHPYPYLWQVPLGPP